MFSSCTFRRRAVTVATLAAVGLTLGAGVASAHVSVNPDTAVAGSYTKITFRVPNESAKADTVKISVQFPMDHPLASVSVKKEPGWTAAVTTSKLTTAVSDDDNASITEAVSSVTWTADAGSRIALGQFAEFDLSVGPVPKVASLAFDTTQTYSDGSVVKWDEATSASGEEPEHPAPLLTVTPAGAATAAPPAAAPLVAAATGSDGTARLLGVVGIIVGAVGLLVAAVAVRGRRTSS